MNLVFLRALKAPSATFAADTEEPIRAELFSIERLEQHAESLAAAQPVTTRPKTGRRLAARLRENGRVLLDAYRAIAAAIREERAITPAAEWLVDNFHVVEEQIREIRDDLPRGFYRQLPKLADGPLEGYPRVFGIAWAFVAHTDSRFDPQMLGRFVQAYQRVQPLTIGELWAVAITLRIVLVENLRRSAERIASGRAARQEADALADRLLGVGGREAEPAETVLKGFEQTPLPSGLRGPAGSALARSGSQGDAGAAVAGPTAAGPGNDGRRDRPRGASGARRDERDRAQRDHEHAPHVRRRLGGVLRERQSGRCGAARRTATSPRWISRPAIAIGTRSKNSREARATPRSKSPDSRSRPPSARPPRVRTATAQLLAASRIPAIYLISRGRHALEKELGFRAPLRDWIVRANAAAGILGYLGTIAVVSAIILALLLFALAESGVSGWTRFILAILAVIPAMDAAVSLVNRAVTICIGPATLPGLELHDGVPAEAAHDGRGAHSSDDAGGTRGAGRASGGSLSGESGRRLSLRAALGLDRFRD